MSDVLDKRKEDDKYLREQTPLKHYLCMQLAFQLLLLTFLSVCRWAMIQITVGTRLPNVLNSNLGYIPMTLLQGLWRDNVLAALLLIFPTMAFIATLFIFRKNPTSWKILFTSSAIYYAIVHPLCVFSSIATIPYYAEFSKLIDATALHMLNGESGQIIADMIFSDAEYFNYALIAIILVLVHIFFIVMIARFFIKKAEPKCIIPTNEYLYIGFSLIYILLSLYYRPTNVNQAHYSNDQSYDRMALSSALYLGISLLHQGDEAYASASNYVSFLSSEQIDSLSHIYDIGGNARLPEDTSFFQRSIINVGPKVTISNPNIVLILMEGMSARLMASFGQRDGLTPFLDSIYNKSLHFSHCYSVGMRTSNGIFGTLTSWPSVLCYHPIHANQSFPFNGLPVMLHKIGYHNMFFIPHQAEFDGLNYFLPRQLFDDIYSKINYDASRFVNSWGPNDEYVFEYAIPVMRKAAAENAPFFATILSISNHAPYALPATFKPHSSDLKFQMVEYADYALRQFFEAAQQESWYENTLFVLVADHGRIQQETECELPDQLNHIPLIIFGAGLDPQECTSMTSQMDIMHIILGLLNKDDNTLDFGVDVLSTPRRYVTYCSWTAMACRSLDRLYIFNKEDNRESFYLIKDDGTLKVTSVDQEFQMMKEYLQLIYQYSDNLLLPYKQNAEWLNMPNK